MTQEPNAPTPAAPTPVTGGDASADEQSELDLGVISTGVPDIDRALTPLEGLGERPVPEHPEVYEQVLGELSATMAENPVDDRDATDASAPVSDDPVSDGPGAAASGTRAFGAG